MKKKFKKILKRIFNLKFVLSALCILIIISFALCILLSYLIYGVFDWKAIFFEIIKIGLSTFVITIPLGVFAKIITDKLFSVNVDMKKMKKLGIDGIGTGLLSLKEEEMMFGSCKTKNYPKHLKLMFLTGKSFLNIYKEQIIECINNGCKVQLLLASYDETNCEYFKRDANLHRAGEDNVDYVNEITNQSLKHIKYIRENSLYPENFKLRFYKDEFQNNLRISKYISGDKDVSYYWINLQPLSKCAKALSIALKGTVANDIGHIISNSESENNLCLASEIGFDSLWDEYANTEQ